VSDIRLATIYFNSAGTGGNKKDAHGEMHDHPELQADLDAGWRLTNMKSVGGGSSSVGELNGWLLVTLTRVDSAAPQPRQRLVSLFLTPKGFGIRQKDDAGRYDSYPKLDEYLNEGWYPAEITEVGFSTWGGTGTSAGWVVVLLEKL
jgi:hypothetical protein